MIHDHPLMAPLTDSTSIIGDRAALSAAMDRDGYWYFRGVLDVDAIARMRSRFLNVLKTMGVVDDDASEAVWNGESLENFPEKIEVLHEQRAWRAFVGEPAIHAFFTRFLGVSPFWIPSVEYRITPPAQKPVDDPLTGRHQDGFANGGIDLKTCWVPLDEIDGTMGGLALAAGLQHGGMLHDPNDVPRHRIPHGAIPDDVWKRSDYRPGDLVMFCPEIPHSGMVNQSNKFRLSVDVRVMPIDGDLPLVGEVLSIGPNHIVVANHDGRDARVRLTADTYCRGVTGARIPLADMVERVRIGDPVIVPCRDGEAVMLRPQR